MTADTAHSGIREIDTGALPDRYARGWHCLGPVKDYLDGKPHGVEIFGTMLVVFADSQGDVKILDGYCRHMGGNLSQGTIKGDEVACPFHDWRWGGDGKCKLVPYAKRTPRLARTRAWTTDVRGGLLFVWHDHEGNPPPPEVRDPRHPRVRRRRVDRLAMEHDAHRGLQLPRDHRQRHRHGALLLHPLRPADVLQERLRGPYRVAVPAQRRPAGRERPGHLLRRGAPGLRGSATSGRRS